jgi:hypothetical protein
MRNTILLSCALLFLSALSAPAQVNQLTFSDATLGGDVTIELLLPSQSSIPTPFSIHVKKGDTGASKAAAFVTKINLFFTTNGAPAPVQLSDTSNSTVMVKPGFNKGTQIARLFLSTE